MKVNFALRSNSPELIDLQMFSVDEYRKNLVELDTFNRLTGSIRFTLIQLSHNIDNPLGQYHLVDLGCGGGEFLRAADKWSKNKNIHLTLSGIDNNHIAIDYLNERSTENDKIKGYALDYKTFLNDYPGTIDFIHCSLFCHHLSNDELIDLIRIAQKKNAVLIINDLLRHPLAYYGAQMLTTLFNGTKLARNDGPVSVLKGFTKTELLSLIRQAGAFNYRLFFIPFFRFVAVIKPHRNGDD